MTQSNNNLTIEKVGRRLYVVGNSYAVKDCLKSIGCKWDGDRRQWWIGTGKQAELERCIGQAGKEPTQDSTDDIKLVAKAKYKGKTYYVPWMGTTKSGAQKARLITLDAKVDFWVDLDAVEIVKEYHPRERTYGYGRHTETVYTTLGSIRRFIERERANREAGGEVCAECGKSGNLVADLEDGMLKHYHCCDMPPH